MENNVLVENTLRICVKANKYCFGDTMFNAIRANKIYLVLVASDAGKASAKKVFDKCTYYNIKCLNFQDKNTLYDIFKKDISSVGITDENLAKKILENLKREVDKYGN